MLQNLSDAAKIKILLVMFGVNQVLWLNLLANMIKDYNLERTRRLELYNLAMMLVKHVDPSDPALKKDIAVFEAFKEITENIDNGG